MHKSRRTGMHKSRRTGMHKSRRTGMHKSRRTGMHKYEINNQSYPKYRLSQIPHDNFSPREHGRPCDVIFRGKEMFEPLRHLLRLHPVGQSVRNSPETGRQVPSGNGAFLAFNGPDSLGADDAEETVKPFRGGHISGFSVHETGHHGLGGGRHQRNSVIANTFAEGTKVLAALNVVAERRPKSVGPPLLLLQNLRMVLLPADDVHRMATGRHVDATVQISRQVYGLIGRVEIFSFLGEHSGRLYHHTHHHQAVCFTTLHQRLHKVS